MSNRAADGDPTSVPAATPPSTLTRCVISLLVLLTPFSARAGGTGFDGWEGAFQVLLRGVYLDPQNHGATQYPPQLHVDAGFYGELSAAWFMTPLLAMELSLGQVSNFGSRIETAGTAVDSGPIRMMPNTWTLQYRFAEEGAVRPYLGAGLHYTILSIQPVVVNSTYAIDRSNLGYVLQGGLDVRLTRGWFVNADLRYLGNLQPQVTIDGGTHRITGYINPLLFSVGVGIRW
jgi:outer membrane protein